MFLHIVMPTEVGIHDFCAANKVVDADLRRHDVEIYRGARA